MLPANANTRSLWNNTVVYTALSAQHVSTVIIVHRSNIRRKGKKKK